MRPRRGAASWREGAFLEAPLGETALAAGNVRTPGYPRVIEEASEVHVDRLGGSLPVFPACRIPWAAQQETEGAHIIEPQMALRLPSA